ncbi:MAG: hypothetical protein KDJ16_04545 [Hyphomicrobiales bacterium]|nr:hypothetical protein [Hyphomicrobiales bacterium]
MFRFYRKISMLICFVAGLAGSAAAGELAEFHAAVEAAQAHFRVAAAYLRTGNTDLAAIELEEMTDKWSALTARFAGNVPDAYDGNPTYATALAETAKRIEDALAAIDSGKSDEARDILLPIRALLSDMRRGSGFYLLADCIGDINAAMEGLRAYRHEPPNLEDAAAAAKLIEAGAIYGRELARCDAMASEEVAADQEFRRLMDTARESTARITEAAVTKDPGLFIRILRELLSIDNLLFFRFG